MSLPVNIYDEEKTNWNTCDWSCVIIEIFRLIHTEEKLISDVTHIDFFDMMHHLIRQSLSQNEWFVFTLELNHAHTYYDLQTIYMKKLWLLYGTINMDKLYFSLMNMIPNILEINPVKAMILYFVDYYFVTNKIPRDIIYYFPFISENKLYTLFRNFQYRDDLDELHDCELELSVRILRQPIQRLDISKETENETRALIEEINMISKYLVTTEDMKNFILTSVNHIILLKDQHYNKQALLTEKDFELYRPGFGKNSIEITYVSNKIKIYPEWKYVVYDEFITYLIQRYRPLELARRFKMYYDLYTLWEINVKNAQNGIKPLR